MSALSTQQRDEKNFLSVTEIACDEVTQEQIDRICRRYYWARDYCHDKDVLEIACGCGIGMGIIAKASRNFMAGDYCKQLLAIAKKHYRERIPLVLLDAQQMPLQDNSKDIIIIFEAIYYLPNFQQFISECKRVLKPKGTILISTANKDLFDFNASPFSVKYYGVKELSEELGHNGFVTSFWGDTPIEKISVLQNILRPVKKIAVALNLIPKSMNAKKILKRLVFGKLVEMPAEITDETSEYILPREIEGQIPDYKNKVILCAAKLIG